MESLFTREIVANVSLKVRFRCLKQTGNIPTLKKKMSSVNTVTMLHPACDDDTLSNRHESLPFPFGGLLCSGAAAECRHGEE